MAKKGNKLNSMRLLEANNIPYEAIEYPDTIKDAVEVAEALGVPEYLVYKTLVVEPATGGKPMLVMIPAAKRLDLKQMAKAAGEKKVQMATHANAEKMTGLQVGGISALALTQKNWQVYLDKSASELEHIIISAGQRGTQLRVPTLALLQVLKARYADVAIDS